MREMLIIFIKELTIEIKTINRINIIKVKLNKKNIYKVNN